MLNVLAEEENVELHTVFPVNTPGPACIDPADLGKATVLSFYFRELFLKPLPVCLQGNQFRTNLSGFFSRGGLLSCP